MTCKYDAAALGPFAPLFIGEKLIMREPNVGSNHGAAVETIFLSSVPIMCIFKNHEY